MIVVDIEYQFYKHKTNASKVHEQTGIAKSTISKLKNGQTKGIDFVTLDKLCKYFSCQPGDLIEYKSEE